MKRWLTIGTILMGVLVRAQDNTIDLEQFAERLFQMQDQDISYEDIYESLLLLYTHPLNLNTVTPEEMSSLYLLSPIQISHFFNYRDQYGKLLSIHELQSIPSFDQETIRSMLPFVTVEESNPNTRPLLFRMIEEENNYLLLRYSRRLETQKGYTPPTPLDTSFIRDEANQIIDTVTTPPSRYLGSPNKYYGRFRTSRKNDFSLGITFEKDDGEAFIFDGQRKSFDFYSYHLLLENKWGFHELLLGDFQLQVGQGLVFGAGFNAGKGAGTVNTIKRNNLGIRPYTSVLESGFFRGVATSKKWSHVELTLFYSTIKQDGILRSDTTFSDFDEFVNAIQQTGFHRTASELNAKDQLTEKSIGSVFTYKPVRNISLGASFLNTNYSTAIQRKPNNYNQFEFKGDHHYVGSLFGNYLWQNVNIFGEIAQSKSGGMGAIAGFISSLSGSIDIAVAVRSYDRDFHSFYGNALAENARNINEKGIYWGFAIKPSRQHQINGYYDQFSFPWLKYQTEAPSIGNEWLVRYTYTPNRKVNMHAQVRQQLRQVTKPAENLNLLIDQTKYNILFNIAYVATSNLAFKTKVQSSTMREGEVFTKGFVILQDLNFNFWKLKFNTRVALFETDDFANAQYVYENDVLYAFSIPAYFGQGMRSYVMVRYDLFKKISFWFRYANFTYSHQESVGSGLSEVQGNTSSEVKLMARITF